MDTMHHLKFMSLALQLAERGHFTVSPNPMVGCVIVKKQEIIGQGFHVQAGGAHAEILALQAAGANAKDATLYVTLEPCCHTGKTPPCVPALIQAGIKKIYVACLDPNPKMAGKSISLLRSAGIEVEVGLAEAAAKQLNEIFFHYITQQRPFVIAKWAMSLDGKTVTHPNDTRQISSPESHYHAHQLRRQVDAILIGANTARLDNPELTARLKPATDHITKQPTRIILSSGEPLPPQLKIFAADLPGKTIIATTKALTVPSTVETLILPKNNAGEVDLPSLLTALWQREISSVLVEGGMRVHASFFQQNLVNKIHVYLAPVIIGSLAKKHPLTEVTFAPLGQDFYCTATYQEPIHV